MLEIAKGAKPKDAFLKYVALELSDLSDDKKYISKIVHKWKKELYENREMLFFLNHDVDDEMIEEEILSLGNDLDEIINISQAIEEIKNNYLKLLK